jgi:hypothetical protein
MEVEQILIFLLFGFLGLVFLLLDFYLSKKRNKREGEISLRFSENFWKKLEAMIEEETRKTVGEIEKKIVENLIEEERKQISNFSQRLEGMAEEQKKQILDFYQKIEEKRKSFEQTMKIEAFEFVQSLIKEKSLISKEIKEFTQSLLKEKETIDKEMKLMGEKIIEEMNKKISQTLESFSERINKKLSESEKIIEDYKEKKLKEIDREIYRMVGEVTKKILGKVIDLSTHEKLVVEALEKAKKERFF